VQTRMILAVIGPVFLLSSCMSSNSKLGESPDSHNKPWLLGITGPYRWDDVKDATSGALPIPWSDTYWPLATRGLAWRWAAGALNDPKPSIPKTLGDSARDLKRLSNGSDWSRSIRLSPAEKYDILAGNIGGIPNQIWARLDAMQTTYDSSVQPQLQPLDRDFSAAWQRLLAAQDTINKVSEAFNATSARYTALATTDDAVALAAAKVDLETDFKNMQHAYADIQAISDEIDGLNQKKRSIRAQFSSEEGRMAKALAAYLPLTADGWQVWDQHEESSIKDYAWMGHCHGWAAAALVAPRPLHAVLAVRGGTKVMLTEGDLRGLLTKIWAEQSADSRFGARRCESDDFSRNASGRVTDGQVCEGQTSGTCGNGKTIYLKNNFIEAGWIQYRTKVASSETTFAAVSRELGGDHYLVDLFSDAKAMRAWRKERSGPRPPQAILHLKAGCRDVNPMLLHLALTKLIKEKKIGFVFDRTRGSQVWNQPVYAYDLKYLPIKLKGVNGNPPTDSVPGEPVDVSLIDDPFADYRAKGTKYLVNIAASLKYGVESGPRPSYSRDGSDEAGTTLSTSYNLELDADRKIIGGEWGRLASTHESLEYAEEQPDFLWYVAPGSVPTNMGPLDPSVVAKLQACANAQATQRTEVTLFDHFKGQEVTQSLEYSECQI